MTKPRPAVFIGSSTEGLKIAEAIQVNLDRACETTVWSQGVFGLSQGTLESLAHRLDSFDFAVLVLTPDDVTHSREATEQSPRDNVLLELGMFIGKLGVERTFIVCDRGKKLKLPSDLAGVTPATFEMHTDGNLQSSLGAATTTIKGTIQQLGKRMEKISANIDIHAQFQIIHDLLDDAAEQFMIWMFEQNKSMRRTTDFDFGITFEYLLDNGTRGSGSFSINQLCRKLPDADLLQVNLRDDVSLTDRGKRFAEWLIENGHKAAYFRFDDGQWGELPEGGMGSIFGELTTKPDLSGRLRRQK